MQERHGLTPDAIARCVEGILDGVSSKALRQ